MIADCRGWRGCRRLLDEGDGFVDAQEERTCPQQIIKSLVAIPLGDLLSRLPLLCTGMGTGGEKRRGYNAACTCGTSKPIRTADSIRLVRL